MLIDEDPTFRLGMQIALEPFSDLQWVAEAADGQTALSILEQLSPPAGVQLVVLDVELGRSRPDQILGLTLCRQIKVRYPTLPVLLLGRSVEPVMLAAARQAGASSYFSKQVEPRELVRIIRQIAAGRSGDLITQPIDSQNLTRRPPGVWAQLRRRVRLSGLRQIDVTLDEVNAELQNLDLSLLDRAFLAGRRRELRAARWLVKQLLATPNLPEPVESESRPVNSVSPASLPIDRVVTSPEAAIVTTSSSALAGHARELQSILFDALSAKIQTSLENQSEVPLETDVLRDDKKRELFYLVLRKIEDLLSELRFSQVEADQLEAKRASLLLDLWQAVMIDFFGKYYTVQISGYEVQVVDVLLRDANIVYDAILDRVPDVIDLLQHLLFQTPLVVDQVIYPPGNPEALARAELLLDNWVVQVANSVIQPLLNRFAGVDAIKQSFFDRRFLSIREIERFRNDLSWRYRVRQWVKEPTAIFESRYDLFTLTGRSIKQTSIRASRNQEFENLSGIPRTVTLLLEARDAVAPRFRSAIALVGNGLVYILTDVVGRGLGLVGRGILKGIGNAWQDGRYTRK
jgi:DNA-binding NarL/FixJ family response regulator